MITQVNGAFWLAAIALVIIALASSIVVAFEAASRAQHLTLCSRRETDRAAAPRPTIHGGMFMALVDSGGLNIGRLDLTESEFTLLMLKHGYS